LPLDEIDHSLLVKANQRFADDTTPHERIVAIDDRILFKVKAQRWRGAVWTEPAPAWLVAAGSREAGSPDDFYAALAADSQAARARYNAEHQAPLTTDTHTNHLLPAVEDRDRLHAEAGVRFDRRLAATIALLLRASLHDGKEHAASPGSFTLGIQVRAESGHETYVAVRVTGSVPLNLVGAILDLIPGCDPDGWFPEFAGLPDRSLHAGEVAWSNIMDPAAAAKLLDIDEE
jgi:hypothetical protein